MIKLKNILDEMIHTKLLQLLLRPTIHIYRLFLYSPLTFNVLYHKSEDDSDNIDDEKSCHNSFNC